MAKTIMCVYCGNPTVATRSTKRFCSSICAQRYARGYPKTRLCRLCGAEFKVITRGDCNRQYCSEACSKRANTKRLADWWNKHPGAMKRYNTTRVQKSPSVWREKCRAERLETIRLLGGHCIVCAVSNPNWLHVDYIPTTRNKPYRHPRHLAHIRKHLQEFRLLCANHHYELTLTGRIEGTAITQ